MYDKNLTEDLRLRLSLTDMNFLRSLSEERNVSLSEVIRSIIGEYRRSLETMKTLTSALEIMRKAEREKELSHGDTETDINHQL